MSSSSADAGLPRNGTNHTMWGKWHSVFLPVAAIAHGEGLQNQWVGLEGIIVQHSAQAERPEDYILDEAEDEHE